MRQRTDATGQRGKTDDKGVRCHATPDPPDTLVVSCDIFFGKGKVRTAAFGCLPEELHLPLNPNGRHNFGGCASWRHKPVHRPGCPQAWPLRKDWWPPPQLGKKFCALRGLKPAPPAVPTGSRSGPAELLQRYRIQHPQGVTADLDQPFAAEAAHQPGQGFRRDRQL